MSQQPIGVWKSSGATSSYTRSLRSGGPGESLSAYQELPQKRPSKPVLSSVCGHLTDELPRRSQIQLKTFADINGRVGVWNQSGIVPVSVTGIGQAFSTNLAPNFINYSTSLNFITENIKAGGLMARHTGGWVKFWRKAALGDINSNFTRGGLFGALIAMANIQESTVDWGGNPLKLQRGQIVTSLHELAEIGAVDRKTVSKHLAYLRARNTINLQITKQGVLITFVNYEQYAGVDAERSPQGPHSMDDGMDNGVPHNEELKNKRIKEIRALFLKCSGRYKELFPETDLGPAEARFFAQFKTPLAVEPHLASIENYYEFLSREENSYRRPKQSYATYLGTKRSGTFWIDYTSPKPRDAKANGSTGGYGV